MTAVPSVYTWTDGEVPDGNTMNTHVRDPQNWLLTLPIFVARNTVSTAVPTSGLLVPLNVVDKNLGFTHAANDSKVYATQPGWYAYTLLGSVDSTTTGADNNRGIWLYKNGAEAASPGGGYSGAMDVATREDGIGGRTGLVYLNGTTDYVEMFLYQSTASSTDVVTFVTSGMFPTFSLLWQGRDA